MLGVAAYTTRYDHGANPRSFVPDSDERAIRRRLVSELGAGIVGAGYMGRATRTSTSKCRASVS